MSLWNNAVYVHTAVKILDAKQKTSRAGYAGDETSKDDKSGDPLVDVKSFGKVDRDRSVEMMCWGTLRGLKQVRRISNSTK
jgi:hypothetical protein